MSSPSHRFETGPGRNDVLVLAASVAASEAVGASLGLRGARYASFRQMEQLWANRGELPDAPALAIIIDDDPNSICALVGKLRQRWTRLRVLVLGTPNDERAVLRCARAGASGIVLDDESLTELCQAVEDCMRVGFRPPPRLPRPFVDRLVRLAAPEARSCSGAWLAGLSTRELEILDAVAHGSTNKQIAVALHIELQTVKNHVTHVLTKLRVHTRWDAVRLAASHLVMVA